MRLGIARWGLLAAVAGSLAGCLGGGGDGGSPAPTTSTPTPTTPTVASQPPTLGPGNSTYNVASLSADQWAALQLDTTNSKVTGASVNSPPKVYFNVVDAAGNPVAGLKAGTGGNLNFTIGKLVPGTNGAPSKWVSYIVMNQTNTPGKPNVENYGTLVDNGNGSYVYTFFRDITKAKDELAAATLATSCSTDPASLTYCNKADLGDLTYEPNLTHRIAITINGTTANSTKPLADPINIVYDFVPATGAEVAQTETDTAKQRLLVDTRNCQSCHVKFYVHGGGANQLAGIGGPRQDTRVCVLCHTDQRKYSVPEATIGLTKVTPTQTNGSTDRIGNKPMTVWPSLIHMVHMGEYLVKTGYYHAGGGGFSPSHIAFPQDPRNCTKCHSDNDGATGGNTVPQAANWKSAPSRMACGGCHDGIDFATGTGYALEQKKEATLNAAKLSLPVTATAATAELAKLTPKGHVGGAQSSDQNCVLCHTADVVATQHLPVSTPLATSVANNAISASVSTTAFAATSDNKPTGAKVITYELGSVTLNASRQPVVKFKVKADGQDVSFNTPAAGAQLMNNFTGSTNLYIAYGLPQDGVATPADWNGYQNVDILAVFQGQANAATVGTWADKDSSGFYTITFPASKAIPADAASMTAIMGAAGGFSQTDVAGYSALNVVADPVLKAVTATGNSARRAIVDKNRCNSCHNKLGTFYISNFHGSQRTDPQVCHMCHNSNRGSSGWSVTSTAFIHAIHAGAKRANALTWHTTSGIGVKLGNPDAFADIGYPGTLRECRQCHLPDTVNFGTTASKAAAENGNLLPNTVAAGSITGTLSGGGVLASWGTTDFRVSPWVTPGSYGTNLGTQRTTALTDANLTAARDTLVTSPIANACFSCHDTNPAKAHMESNGGYVYKSRATLNPNYDTVGHADKGKLPKTEQCVVCHGKGKVVDAETIHRSSAGLTATERN